jgi:hypothetical protein
MGLEAIECGLNSGGNEYVWWGQHGSGSIICGEFLDQSGTCERLKKYAALWSHYKLQRRIVSMEWNWRDLIIEQSRYEGTI